MEKTIESATVHFFRREATRLVRAARKARRHHNYPLSHKLLVQSITAMGRAKKESGL